MKIAYLTDRNSLHVNIKAKYFEGTKDSVSFFALSQTGELADERLKQVYHPLLEVIMLPMDDISAGECFRNCLRIRQEVRKRRIDLVHVIDMNYYWYGIFLPLLGIRTVLENNGSDVLRLPDNNPKLKKWYRIAYTLCSGVVQDSSVSQKRGIELGAPVRHNEIIELGVDLKVFRLGVKKGEFRKKYGIPEDTKIVFSPRAFAPLYNIGDIIKTMPEVIRANGHVRYVFCSYIKNPYWISLIKKLKMEKYVILLGYVDNEKELPYIYADSDVVVSIPSSDSSPRTVYEAMACGCTVIASDLPWLQGKLRKGAEILTVPVRDVQRLTEAITGVLEGRSRLEPEIVNSWVKRNLDYRICKKKLRLFYKQILYKNKKKRYKVGSRDCGKKKNRI